MREVHRSAIILFVLGILLPRIAPAEQPLSELERSMEANLMWNLQGALSAYYPETKFVVNANVNLSPVFEQKMLPKLPEALLSRSVTNLPGLPYLPDPETTTQQKSNPGRAVESRNYEVGNIRITVLVDRSLSEEDWSFIRRLVALTANLEPGRGDQVRIEALSFPEKVPFKPHEIPRPAEQSVPDTPLLIPRADRMVNSEMFPLWFAAGIGLLLVALFVYGLRSVARTLAQGDKTSAIVSRPQVTAPLTVTPQAPPVEKNPGDESVKRYASAAIDALVGTPSASARVVNQWMEERGEQGEREAAVLFASVSISLLDTIAPYLGGDGVASVKRKLLEVTEEQRNSEAPVVLRQFDEDLRRLVLKAGEADEEQEALSFLNQMTDDQVQHLLKPLKVGVKAIVLAHLRANRAAKIVGKMEPNERQAVLAAIGNIERIPLEVYQHIARQLSLRANELRKMRYVRANGVDALLKVMEHLDDYTQDDVLDYLRTQDVQLAQKVSKNFMTFNELLELPGDQLRHYARDFDRETLAKSLIRVDESEVERIINSLPERLAELVRASLESQSAVADEDVEQARRELMRSVRAKKFQKVS
jgi:flagellar motor switch protein FliG